MSKHKKSHYPAKDSSLLIGNQHKTGKSKLGISSATNNHTKRRSIDVLKHTLVNGYSTYLKVVEGLESKSGEVLQ